MTYLVTGVAGFIGSKTAQFLLEQGHAVVGVDNLNDYYDVRLKDFRLGQLLQDDRWKRGSDPRKTTFSATEKRGNFTFHALDIEDLTKVETLFREHKFDAVLNLAARAGVRASMENPFVYMTTNAMASLNLLECMRRHGCPKMVLASTSSLYAGQKMPFTEELAVNTPLSPYAASKKAAEMMAYSYHKLYGLDISVVRYFTVFGPAGRPDMSIYRFIQWMLADEPLQIFGDGSQSRDFTYVDDIARGTIAALKPVGYQVINLGGGRNPISLLQVIQMLEQFTGKKARWNSGAFHIADIKETWADITKADKLLGWQPQISPEEGFRRTVAWHLANQDTLRSIILP